MRWLVVIAFVAGFGCKKSDKKAPPPPVGEDAAPVVATADAAAPPAAVDAAAPPAEIDAAAGAGAPAGGHPFTGSYEIAFELPAKYKCEDEKARVEPKQTFDVAIDPDFPDQLVVTGADGGWEASEVSTGGDKGQYLYVTLTNKAD